MTLVDLHQHTFTGIYHKIIEECPGFFDQDIVLIHIQYTQYRREPDYVVRYLRKDFDLGNELNEESQLLGQFRLYSNARLFASALIAERRD